MMICIIILHTAKHLGVEPAATVDEVVLVFIFQDQIPFKQLSYFHWSEHLSTSFHLSECEVVGCVLVCTSATLNLFFKWQLPSMSLYTATCKFSDEWGRQGKERWSESELFLYIILLMIYLKNVSVDVDVLMLLKGEEKNSPSATALIFGQHPQC